MKLFQLKLVNSLWSQFKGERMVLNLTESQIVNKLDCEHLKRVEDLDKLECFNNLIMIDLKECGKEYLENYNKQIEKAGTFNGQ